MLPRERRDRRSTAVYVGQVERDQRGALWAVLYCGDDVVNREPVRSLRRGRRRVTDLVLAAADNQPHGPIATIGTVPPRTRPLVAVG